MCYIYFALKLVLKWSYQNKRFTSSFTANNFQVKNCLTFRIVQLFEHLHAVWVDQAIILLAESHTTQHASVNTSMTNVVVDCVKFILFFSYLIILRYNYCHFRNESDSLRCRIAKCGHISKNICAAAEIIRVFKFAKFVDAKQRMTTNLIEIIIISECLSIKNTIVSIRLRVR